MERVDYESLIIQDLLNYHSSKSLDINPWYQRRSVWSTPQKSYLINTIFERKPVPSIYIRHQIDIDNERSVKEVVDGQQRIRTILSYRANEFAAKHPDHKKKLAFSELSRAEKGHFLATPLSVGYLIGATDIDVIEIFGRINSISKTLNPQEKRNAQFSGDFKQFSLQQASERLPFWRSTNIFSANDISRMQEVQFISDLAINMIEGLRDFSASQIDLYYKLNDEEFLQADEIAERMDKIFSYLVALPPELFSDTIFKQYQLTFSIMVVLDRLRDRSISSDQIHEAIRSIDAQATAYRDRDILNDVETTFLEGFTGANLHRIRTRRIRDQVLEAALI